ncbi:hypothetical protein CH373_08605 [Leptospira perolatii]|uniref:phospholipase D n=1 Tax=Leptospira perolatii TaxID=2023191 RepID=A0A2M9ZNF9_9LEPT|nr:phospholipase D-like domain-containing protein [Leptospira perolatii]PJZ69568.1 hypothetical protein CH360_09750 [Leptospira perolatii]PJZ73555.1 hypothetical protein CH373_08605 [Leptospira perolatii]
MKTKRIAQILLILQFSIFVNCFRSASNPSNLLSSLVTSASATPNLKYSTAHIQIYFTNPLSDPEADDAIIGVINQAKSGTFLDLALYGLNREVIIVAVENAIDRGVHVRMVGDKDGTGTVAAKGGEYYEGYLRIANKLDQKFPVSGKLRSNFPVDSGFNDFILINSGAIQHNKFGVIHTSDEKDYVFTGSTNLTDSDFERNNNNLILFQDSGIAGTYRNQFEYLLGLPGSSRVSTVRQHYIDGIRFDVLFSPGMIDGKTAMDHLMDRVTNASATIHFLIFSFPHRYLNDLVLSKFFDSGLDVKGVFDFTQLNNSAEEYYAQHGIPVKIDGNYYEQDGHGGKLHHKVMILDSQENDAVVVTGSFNWSDNANNENNENLMFIYSKEIAQFYEDEFSRRFVEGTPVPTVSPGDPSTQGSVILNEVMWAGRRGATGTSAYADYTDEFIELKNITNQRIDLSGWAIKGASTSGKPMVLPSGTYIDGNSYLVLMSYAPSESAWQPTKYKVANNLSVSNDELYLVLEDINRTSIDVAGKKGTNPESFAGSNGTPKKSMSRNSQPGDGSQSASWFSATIQTNIASSFLAYNFATPGAPNSNATSTRDIIFSEIAWAGTDISASDEWIELRNLTSSPIDLTGWTITVDDGTPSDILLSGTIPAGGYFLLERTDDTSVPGLSADLIYTGGMNNSSTRLILKRQTTAIDETPIGNWPAGTNSPTHISMERANPNSDGTLASSWKNGLGDIEGAQNSGSH